MAGYLFVHFIGEQKDGEQIYFSLSRDGLHFQDLNHGNPVLYSKTGTLGVRDPFPVRDPETGRFYLIATDLRIGSGTSWEGSDRLGERGSGSLEHGARLYGRDSKGGLCVGSGGRL